MSAFRVSFKQGAGRQNANAGAVFGVARRWLRKYIDSTRTCDQHQAVHAKDSIFPYSIPKAYPHDTAKNLSEGIFSYLCSNDFDQLQEYLHLTLLSVSPRFHVPQISSWL